LKNAVTDRYLDADGQSQDWNVETSRSVRDDDRWGFGIANNGGAVTLTNLQFNRYLWAENGGAYNVETVGLPSAGAQWELVFIDG
jgi:hypothetical protein